MPRQRIVRHREFDRFEPVALLTAVVSTDGDLVRAALGQGAAGIVIEAVTDGHVPLWLGALVAYGIVIVYVLVSGAMAVGWTNTFQGILFNLSDATFHSIKKVWKNVFWNAALKRRGYFKKMD